MKCKIIEASEEKTYPYLARGASLGFSDNLYYILSENYGLLIGDTEAGYISENLLIRLKGKVIFEIA